MRRVAVLSLALLAACVDGAAEPGPSGPDTDEVIADDKADAPGELRARIDGLTVWLRPVARLGQTDGEIYVDIEGRTSKNLAEVHAWVPDDRFGTAQIVSARKFVVTLGSGHEVNTMLSGLPLFIGITPTSGAPAEAAVWLAPRLGNATGSSRIYLNTTVTPSWVGGDVIYRGGATLAAGYDQLTVTAPAAAPTVAATGTARKYRVDWTFTDLAAALRAPGQAVLAEAHKGATTVTKDAAFEVRVARLGLTARDPREVWPRQCDDEVFACLVELGPDVVDAGACGTYRQVQACGGPAAVTIAPATLARDLRDWLAYWYTLHGADVAAAGGSTLAEAQAAVDPEGFSELADPADDPHGNDLTQVRVFQHADVVFPGSDRAWFSTYERASGTFLEAYDFE